MKERAHYFPLPFLGRSCSARTLLMSDKYGGLCSMTGIGLCVSRKAREQQTETRCVKNSHHGLWGMESGLVCNIVRKHGLLKIEAYTHDSFLSQDWKSWNWGPETLGIKRNVEKEHTEGEWKVSSSPLEDLLYVNRSWSVLRIRSRGD